MTTNNDFISINYSDARLRVLVEEYIAMQRKEFTFQGVCSYIMYWAMEENTSIYESDEMSPGDCERVRRVLEQIVREGRITVTSDGGDTRFEKNME